MKYKLQKEEFNKQLVELFFVLELILHYDFCEKKHYYLLNLHDLNVYFFFSYSKVKNIILILRHSSSKRPITNNISIKTSVQIWIQVLNFVKLMHIWIILKQSDKSLFFRLEKMLTLLLWQRLRNYLLVIEECTKSS